MGGRTSARKTWGCLPDEALTDVTEIHNLAGAFRFGMSKDEAHRGNVVSARRIVALAARLQPSTAGPCLRLSSRQPRADVPRRRGLRPARCLRSLEDRGRRGGAGHAAALGVPFTIVNPSTVSGLSTTGETEQQVGLATNLRDLWLGKLPALPGNAEHVRAGGDRRPPGEVHGAGADGRGGGRPLLLGARRRTPALPELLAEVGRHYDVAVPRLRVPVGL